MKIRFDNEVVLVTGASRGIGEATARLFAEAGASVILQYFRGEEEAEQIMDELPGENNMLISADISDPASVQHMVDTVLNKYGRIHVLVNNAGIFEEADWPGMEYQQWQEYWKKTIDTNLTGVANLSFLVAKSMIGNGGGRIVNVSSRGAFRGEPNALPYGASKAGLNSLGQSMAARLADNKVYVFTLAPGFVMTDMTRNILHSEKGPGIIAQSPMSRVASPEEMARAILMLSSEGMEYATGCILDMNGASYLRS